MKNSLKFQNIILTESALREIEDMSRQIYRDNRLSVAACYTEAVLGFLYRNKLLHDTILDYSALKEQGREKEYTGGKKF